MKIGLALLPIAGVTAACISSATAAQTSVTIYSSAQPGTLSPATFRNGGEGFAIPGYGVVRQSQDVSLMKGRTIIRVSDVPALIDPTTVLFESLTDPAGTRVVEQSFEFDLTSTAKLLQKYLDREVTVEHMFYDGYEWTSNIEGRRLGQKRTRLANLVD